MTDENVKHTKEYSQKGAAHGTDEYDPFIRGDFLLVCVPSKDLIRYGTAGSPVRSGIRRQRNMRARILRQEPRTSSWFRQTTHRAAKWLYAMLQPNPEPTR